MRNNLLLILPDKKEQDLLLNRFQNDYNFYIARNWAEVLHLVETISIQLIICSVDVPVVNGCELPGEEDAFIKKLHDHIYNNVHKSSLNVPLLAKLMNMSRPAFYKKIKTVTQLTPNDLINRARLSRAAELLESTEYKVNEVARMTGFHSQSSLAKTFVKRFKITPTEYRRLKKKTNLQKRAALQMKYLRNNVAAMYN